MTSSSFAKGKAEWTRYSRRTVISSTSSEDYAGFNASALAEAAGTALHVPEYMKDRRKARYAAARPQGKWFFNRPSVDSGSLLLRSLVTTAGLIMPYESTDELNRRLDAATGAVSELRPESKEVPEATFDDVEPPEFRGVVVLDFQYPVLFTKRIEITPKHLPEWEPEFDLDGPRSRDEDV